MKAFRGDVTEIASGGKEENTFMIFHGLYFIYITRVFWFFFFVAWVIALLFSFDTEWQCFWVVDSQIYWQRIVFIHREGLSLCLVTVSASELTEEVSALSHGRQKQKWEEWDFCQNKNIYLILLWKEIEQDMPIIVAS